MKEEVDIDNHAIPSSTNAFDDLPIGGSKGYNLDNLGEIPLTGGKTGYSIPEDPLD
jgi:hypothetical protein